MPPSDQNDLWPESLALRIDALCDQFEAAWQAALAGGPLPCVEDVLRQESAEVQAELLPELVAVDRAYRLRLCARPIDVHEAQTNPQSHEASTGPQPGEATASPTCSGTSVSPQIPGYEVLSELGRGGMGVVFLARQIGLKRLVALKWILTHREESSEARQRFLAEAEAVARLRHPHIVQIHDLGMVAGQPYFTMEYCAGGSLARRLAQSPLEAKEAARLVECLALGVQAAHEAGIIHRDLKPGNVLLLSAEGEAAQTPRITDFGLARVGDSGLTTSERAMGTPSYMPPEQTHDARTVDARADVYALGAILYECLTGRPPFKAATPMETMNQVRNSEPLPPHKLQPSVPRDLETICLKCLQKVPARRYRTASELAQDLRRFTEDRPIAARPVGMAERGWRWARRHRALAGLYAVSAMAVVALLGLGLWFSAMLGAADAQRDAADARTQLADAERTAAESRAGAADRVAATQRYFGLLNKARERIAHKRPGWMRESLAELTEAAKLPDANIAELRREAMVCLGGVDVRQVSTIGKGIAVSSIAWHPDGRRLAIGERGVLANPLSVTITLVDIQRPESAQKLTFAPRVIWEKGTLVPEIPTALAFSPDGRWLVAGARSGMLHRWDLTKAEPSVESRKAHAGSIECLAFATAGTSVYSTDDRAVKRWSMATWKGKEDAAAATNTRTRLAVHPTEGWLACGENNIRCLQADSLRPTRPELVHPVDQVSWLAEEPTLVLSHGGNLCLFSVRSGQVVHTFRSPNQTSAEPHRITDLSVRRDGSLLLSACSRNQRVKLWDVASGRLITDLVATGEPQVAFSPSGKTFVMACDREVRLYAVDGRQEQTLGALHGESLESFAFHPDGRSLVCYRGEPHDPGELAVWSLGAEASRIPMVRRSVLAACDKGEPHPLAVAANGGWLGLALPEHKCVHTAKRFGGLEGKLITTGHRPNTLNFDLDGRLWGDVGDEVRVWEPRTGKLLTSWKQRFGQTLSGRPGVEAVAVGSRWAVAAGRDGAVRTFAATAANLEVQASRTVTTDELRCVAVRQGDELAAAGSEQGRLVLVRLPDAVVLAKHQAHDDCIESVSFGAGGILASGSRDGVIKLWQWDGTELRELLTMQHAQPIRQLAFRADGVTLAVLLRGERAVRLWRLDRVRGRLTEMGLGAGLESVTGVELPSPEVVPPAPPPVSEPAEGVHGLRAELFDDFDLQKCVKVRQDLVIDWDWKGKAPDVLLHPQIFSVRWSGWLKAPRPGRYVLRLSGDGLRRMWLDGKLTLDRSEGRHDVQSALETEVDLGERPHALRIEYRHAGPNTVCRFSWSRAGAFEDQTVPMEVLYLDRDAAARRVPVGEELRPFAHDCHCVLSAAISDSKVALTGDRRGFATLWDMGTGKELRHVALGEMVDAVALAPDGKSFLTGGRDMPIRLWDAATCKEVRRYSEKRLTWKLAFSPSGTRFASTHGPEKCVRVWDVAGGKELWRGYHGGDVLSVAWFPKGDRLVSCGFDGLIRVWDAENGKELYRLKPAGMSHPHGLAVSPAGDRLVAVCYESGRVALCDLKERRVIRVWPGNTRGLWVVAFSPDGSMAVTGGSGGAVRGWDAETGDEVCRFPWGGDDAVCRALAFAPDGRSLLVGGRLPPTGVPRLYRVPLR